MITTEMKILNTLLISLESLQGLSKDQLKVIHELASPRELQTCAEQMQRLADELKEYEGKYKVGTMTEVGLITGVRKNREATKIRQVQISSSTGKSWMTLEELETATHKKPLIAVVNG